MQEVHFILYVQDQARSKDFYSGVLQMAPVLDVPGMTQFELPGGAVLGLMPAQGIRRLLGDALLSPAGGGGAPCSELYLVASPASGYLNRALALGAKLLSEMRLRDWGHTAGYCLDLDGHVLAFAEVAADAAVGE